MTYSESIYRRARAIKDYRISKVIRKVWAGRPRCRERSRFRNLHAANAAKCGECVLRSILGRGSGAIVT